MSDLSNQARAIANQLNIIVTSMEMLADSEGYGIELENGAKVVLLEEFSGLMQMFSVQLGFVFGEFTLLEKELKKCRTKGSGGLIDPDAEEKIDKFLEGENRQSTWEAQWSR